MYRNYQDPLYKQWRIKVYKRDGFLCRYPGCTSKHKLQAHHIKTWAGYPELRYVVSNGITLCNIHHALVWNREVEFEELFTRLVGEKKITKKESIDIKSSLRKRLKDME